MDYRGDKYYLGKVLNGDSNAYGFIVDRHKDKVFSLAHKICGSFEDAEEVAQDSFLKAYRSLRSFRGSSSFSTWLYRITYNTAVSSIRKKNPGILQVEDFPADAADFLRDSESDEMAEKEYRRSLLNFAIQKLAIEERALVGMFYFQELDHDEIASITGLTKSNVKVKLFRARKRIEEIIIKNRVKENIEYEKVG
ncbi:MAG: RNA polymerase sigma factor [Bacteroidales bacterium]